MIQVKTLEEVIQFTNAPGELLDIHALEQNHFHVIVNHKSYDIYVAELNQKDHTVQLLINNARYHFTIQGKVQILLEKMGLSNMISTRVEHLYAPMPGLVIDIIAQDNDNIQKGDKLIILEAMKMENVIKSSSDCTILHIAVAIGNTVEKGQLLMELS